MTIKNIEEIRERLKEKKVQTHEETTKIISDSLKELPNFEKHREMMYIVRGRIIDSSIALETFFNEVILFSDKPSMIKTSFQKKVSFIKRIVRIIDREKKIDKNYYKKLDYLVEIRNLFAHVPHDLFKENLVFETQPPYDKYFERTLELKDIKYSSKEFTDTYNYVNSESNKVIKLIHKYLKEKGSLK